MKKKIIICMTSDIVYDRRILRISNSLSSEFNVHVVCRKLHELDFNDSVLKVQRIKCIFNRGFLFYAEFNLRLLILLISKSYDILVSVDYDTLLPCSFTKRIKGKKLVFDAHEYFEESIEIVDRTKLKRFWTWVGRVGVKNVDLAYTVSSTIAQIYSNMHGLQFATIRNLPKWKGPVKEAKSGSKRIILYQGVLNKGRQLEALIELADEFKELEFWFVGEGDESENLRTTEASNVKFYSWVEPEALRVITAEATLGYNLLDSSSKSYYLSLANKFFDYMHSGVPSLNNEFPEYQSLNERYNCCFTLSVQDSVQLGEVLREYLSDQDLLDEKRKNSLIAARDLSWDREEKKLKLLYKNL